MLSCYGIGMAFITLRRSRNTKSFYLVESYRDDSGRSRKRTLCYLGREQDGTDTIENAVLHWERIGKEASRELRHAKGDRQRMLRSRKAMAEERTRLLRHHLQLAAATEARRKERQLQAEEAEHWQAIEQLRRQPTEDNAQAAKRAFRHLAKRHHPDAGGSHHAFLKLKEAYDRAIRALEHGRWRAA